MQYAAAVLVVIAGCSFSPGTHSTPGGGPGMPMPDGGGVMPPPPPPPPPPTCHDGASDTSLRLCLDFEDAPLGSLEPDLSTFGNNASLVDVAAMARGTQHAVQLAPASMIDVPASSALALSSAYTLELWVDTTAVAHHNALVYPLVNAGNYAVAIDEDGRLECGFDGTFLPGSMKVATGAWVHVACVYQDDHVASLYVNGDADACFGDIGSAGPPTIAPTFIGTAFTGGIDDVHVYARALGDAEVCHDATGGAGCRTCAQTQ